jgi:hypothetical protein
MMRTGALRKSLQSQIIHDNAIKWQSSIPYANIHNTDGTITVTPIYRRTSDRTSSCQKNCRRLV